MHYSVPTLNLTCSAAGRCTSSYETVWYVVLRSCQDGAFTLSSYIIGPETQISLPINIRPIVTFSDVSGLELTEYIMYALCLHSCRKPFE